MKFINKAFIGLLLLDISMNPQTPVEAFTTAMTLMFLTFLWEFAERFTDLIAFNDLMERRAHQSSVRALTWVSKKIFGEDLSDSS